MSAIKGDFIGFTFNGIHSSELGLARVSDGSRYTENLFPTTQDKTIQVPGADGTYYFGSYYTQKPFNFPVVFDNMTEEQFQRIKRIFGDKKIHDLIFDETPYKVYRVKSTGTPNLKYVCFNKDFDEFDRAFNSERRYETKDDLYEVGARSPYGRIYKGEGQLSFTAYDTKARSRFKYIDEYTLQTIPEWGSMDNASANKVHYNLYDWMDSVRLKQSNASKVFNNTNYQIDKATNSGVMVYNPGDFPTHFNLYFLFNGQFNGCLLNSSLATEIKGYLELKPFTLKTGDEGIRINGKLNLIEGIIEDESSAKYTRVKNTRDKHPNQEEWWEYNEVNERYQQSQDLNPISEKKYYVRTVKYIPTGTIYNEYIKAGDFFQIPITSELTWLQISPLSGSSFVMDKVVIEYDYLYY